MENLLFLGVSILKHIRVLAHLKQLLLLLFYVHGKHLRSCRDSQLT